MRKQVRKQVLLYFNDLHWKCGRGAEAGLIRVWMGRGSLDPPHRFYQVFFFFLINGPTIKNPSALLSRGFIGGCSVGGILCDNHPPDPFAGCSYNTADVRGTPDVDGRRCGFIYPARHFNACGAGIDYLIAYCDCPRSSCWRVGLVGWIVFNHLPLPRLI